ncbi:MAG: nucleotidyltransferase family protein [Pseudomonadota bacterium]
MNRDNQKQLASPLVIQSSRPACDDSQIEKLKLAAQELQDGYPIAHEAEQHGLAPLVFHHLRTVGSVIDDKELKKLRVQFVQNRNRNRILMKTLENVLEKLGSAGIDVLVLKGGALGNLIYPDCALRPMGDLDLLVRKNDDERARDTLHDMGFVSRAVKTKHHLRHALPEMSKMVDGISVTLDLHRNVFTNLHTASLELDTVTSPRISFAIGSQEAFTLGYEEMLLHLCHHLITPGQAIKLISVADIVGFVTRYTDRIDWKTVHQKHRFVINTLIMLDLLLPFSHEVRQMAGLEPSGLKSQIGIDYTGWPNTPFSQAGQSENGYWTLFYNSMAAPEWWLRLRYGYGPQYPIGFCRYGIHPIRLAGMALRWYLS